MHGHRAMWTLCEFAPDDPILFEEMERLRPHLSKDGDWLIQSSFDMALICAAGTSQEVFSVIRFILRGVPPQLPLFRKRIPASTTSPCRIGYRAASDALGWVEGYAESERARKVFFRYWSRLLG